MREKQLTLSKSELADALQFVAGTSPGQYTARELYGPAWDDIVRWRAHGKWFKASVLHGDLPGVRWVGRKSNKSLLYEVTVKEASVLAA